MTSRNPSVDFLIIGAAKAGTSSLAKWLNSHRDILMSNPKETMFFASPGLYEKGLQYYHSKYFPEYNGHALIGEATPAYSNRDRHPFVPPRVASFNPNTKIIYIARHPLRKVESTWKMHSNLDLSRPLSPEELHCGTKAQEGFSAYVRDMAIFTNLASVCKYHYQISAWLSSFSRSNIYIMYLEDLARDQGYELTKLCQFLGVSSTPLVTHDLLPVNTLSERKSVREYVKYITKPSLHRILPTSWRKIIRDSFLFSYPHSSRLHAVWPSDVLESFISVIESDLGNFLSISDKPAGFYDLIEAITQ